MATADNDAIELRVDDIAQLFDTLDPYPFPERDLNRDAEEYIVGWARELASHQPIAITVHHPNTAHQRVAFQALKLAMAKYFAARAQSVQQDVNELFRVGRYSLAVGVATLVGCLLMAQLTAHFFENPPVKRLVEESFLILGWVANWRPLEIFLYDWWPIVRKRNLYRRLAAATIEDQPYDAEISDRVGTASSAQASMTEPRPAKRRRANV
jgi:hypothetical protein